jgi:dTDP-glucose 4,6-dehydratase
VVIARSSNNYGPFQYPEKLIPLVIRNALVGEDIPLYGDGRQRRDWLFVEDNCRALLAVLQQGALGAVYNIASGTSRENLEVVRAVCTALADELQQAPEVFLSRIRFTRDRPGHDRAYAMACHRIIRDLGWTPEVSFEDGLRRTVRWYITHREWLSRVDSDTYRAYYEAVYRRGWGGS